MSSKGSSGALSRGSLVSEIEGIIPFQRMEQLEYFYTSDSVKNDKVIEVVDLKDKKKFPEEVQGQWALDQLEATLDVLRVKNFVIPKDKGGFDIPEIESRDIYFEAHLEAKRGTVANLEDSQTARQDYITVLRMKMEKSRGRRETFFQKLQEEREYAGTEQRQSISFEDDEDIDKANDDFANAYARWNREQQAQNEDILRHENIVENCRKHASKQHDDDADAVNRLLSALFAIKKFIQGLMKKFPFLGEIVRNKRKDGIDPYDDNDMRACYINLLNRYRQSDEMGILTTIMSGMGEKQGNKSMSSFLLSVEDWHQTMIRMGVSTISVSDLAAIITLKGMNETHRVEFLHQETALELTLETLDQDEEEDEDGANDGMSTTSVKKEKKSLLVRVKKFIQQDKTKRLINQRLSGGNGISSDNMQASQKKDSEERIREAQNVFAATEDKNSVCQHYAKFGNCRFGDKCKYKHMDKRSNLECFSWRDKGSCKFGDECIFKHGSVNAKEQVTTVKEKSEENKKKKDVKFAKVTTSLFNVDDSGDSWGNKDEGSTRNQEKVDCILTSPELGNEELVLNVTSDRGFTKLGWDSMASINVAKDGTEKTLANLVKVHSNRSAMGLGGSKPITHSGYSTQFGLQMHVIPGGNTPNIKSVARALQTEEDGTEYMAIFTAKGATQLRLNERSKQQIMQILNEASDSQSIVGTAVQCNGVYVENFGEEPAYGKMSEDEKAFAVTSMYTHRVPMSSADDIIGMLVSACVKENHLIAGLKEKSIKGLPECVTVDAVKQYFKNHGKDEDIIMAEITNAPLKTPIDYEKEVFNNPGEHLQIDNVDPSFARMKGEQKPVRSIGGYRDAVVAVDNSGYSVVQGRETKKNPHLVVSRFIEKWKATWHRLKKLSADKEFITVDTMSLCEREQIRVRQAVPYDHRRGLGASEGLNRWLQDCAQAHMNRLTVYVKMNLLSEYDKRTLWFHALQYANEVGQLGPSKLNPGKTQFEEGENVKFNFSTYVLLPFGLRVVIRKKDGDQDGRGVDGIYVGFSKVVTGGILVFMFATKRVVQKYTFVPREPMPTLADIDCEYAATALYGDLQVDRNTSDITDESKVGGDLLDGKPKVKFNMLEDSSHIQKVGSEIQKVGGEKRKPKDKPPNTHFTRSKKIRETVLVVSSERPPKPKLPTRREAKKSDRWMAAYRREVVKINEEETLVGLKKDSLGKFIRPESAIVMKLLAILEWKWKPDPITGMEGWLECVRIVCDGSADKRVGELTYAETPDRTLMFLMSSVEATLGIKSKVGDAVRAYLNAPSIDKNLVVIADEEMMKGEGMEGLSRESLLLKGLYGSTKGALSFQVWADEKLSEVGYKKCDVARGVYLKEVQNAVVRLYRHSDDFKLSTDNDSVMDAEVGAIQGKIRTTPFQKLDRFLGCKFVRYLSSSMVEDDLGDIYLVSMTDQIQKLDKDYGYLIKFYNPTGRVRYTPLPLKPVLDDEDLNDAQKELLSEADITLYMSIVMSIGWVIGNIRPNLKFSHHIVAKKLSCPRVWDMYLAIWLMEHILLTIQWPLIIGGPNVDPAVYSDSSFASMEEKRSIGGHGLVTCKGSGVIYAQVKTYKVAVKSIFEGETMAASDGQDTAIYANTVVQELKYPSQAGGKVLVDNTAAIDWMLGSTPTKRSKHLEVRLYRSRHLVAEGKVTMEHVPSKDNIADLFTKSLPRGQYEVLAKKMLGHELVEVGLRYWEIRT